MVTKKLATDDWGVAVGRAVRFSLAVAAGYRFPSLTRPDENVCPTIQTFSGYV